MKKWLPSLWTGIKRYWDEVLVYIFTIGGVFGYMVTAAKTAGEKFKPDFWSIAGAVVASMALMWLLENRGLGAAAKAGIIDTAVNGRRKNIVLRLVGGAGFGYVGQMVLPQILEAVGKFILGSVQGVLNSMGGSL